MRPQRIEPEPGQESVWDYPRPPKLDPTTDRVVVSIGETTIADSTRAIRVLETSQPPAFYIPREDVDFDLLQPAIGRSFCEWKGEASYFDVITDSRRVDQACWTYESPSTTFLDIASYLAFYAQKLDCSVDGEAVKANEGTFYGGWITSKVVGPFKGGLGSSWW